MNVKEAYTIMGVSENATDEEIEKTFTIWIKRNKASQSRPESDGLTYMDELVEAYNVIKSHRQGLESNQKAETFSSKMKHFLTYYKLHTVSVIILIIICVSIVQGILDYREKQRVLASLPDENLSIILYGDYFGTQPESETVSENILTYFPSWSRVTVDAHYFPAKAKSSFDVGFQQKSAAALATTQPDMYMMNKEVFKNHIQSGMFDPLNELKAPLKQNVDAKNLIYSKADGEETERLYGVVLSDKAIFKGMQILEKEVVVAIRAGAENKDNAMQLIMKLAEKSS